MSTRELPSASARRLVEEVVEVLRQARQRPDMYFDPLTPEAVEYWLYGLRVGLGIAGVAWSLESLTSACAKRGITLTATTNLIEALAKQGHPAEHIALTLLEIAEDMWRGQLAESAEPVLG